MLSESTEATPFPKRTSRLAVLAFALACLSDLLLLASFALDGSLLVYASLAGVVSLLVGLVSLLRIYWRRHQLSGTGYGCLAIALSLPPICFFCLIVFMAYGLAQHGY